MAPKNKSAGDKKGKGKADKVDGVAGEKSAGKVKPAQQINVRHILVSHWPNTRGQKKKPSIDDTTTTIVRETC